MRDKKFKDDVNYRALNVLLPEDTYSKLKAVVRHSTSKTIREYVENTINTSYAKIEKRVKNES
jgi:hypothetical protein